MQRRQLRKKINGALEIDETRTTVEAVFAPSREDDATAKIPFSWKYGRLPRGRFVSEDGSMEAEIIGGATAEREGQPYGTHLLVKAKFSAVFRDETDRRPE